MEVLQLDNLCNSTFWDTNLTWNTDYPRLTPCFQKTVLVWIPCIFLWAFSSIDIYNSLSSKARDIPWNWRNVSKLAIVLVLICICIYELFYHWFQENYVLVDVIAPLIKTLTLLLCCGLIYSHKKYGRRSSGILFLFWFLVVVLGTIQFHSEIEAIFLVGIKTTTQISFMILYLLCFVSLLLNFISDLPPKHLGYPQVEKPIPEESASFPSRLIFSWFDSFAYKGFKRPIVSSDLWNMRYSDTVSEVFSKFDKHWSKSNKTNINVYINDTAKFNKKTGNSLDIKGFRKAKVKLSSSVLPALCKAFGPLFICSALLKLVSDIFTFISPELLKYLIDFVESDEPQWRGYVYATSLLVVATCQTLFLSSSNTLSTFIGLRVKTALISAIYRKALRLSNAARRECAVGEIVNLMSVDAQRFNIIIYLNMLWSAPFQITLSMYFLWQTLGPSVLAGLGFMILLIPLNGYVANRVSELQMKQMKTKDERVKMMNEVLSGMKVLKLYAWVPSFEKLIMKIRDKEIKVLKETAYFNGSMTLIWTVAPFIVSLITFATYVLIDPNNILDAKKAFVALALFNIMKNPLSLFPMVISSTVEANVSLKRINKFMNSEEIDVTSISHDDNEDAPLVIEKGTFSWGVEDEPTLRDINLRIEKGSLVAVVGSVGSGKSSLISVLLGEMDRKAGRVNIQGTVAYVPQLAWIQNATVQNNILFGKSLNNRTYQRVVEVCALKPDLEMLPGGDQTEIGEKGINLSGGQKQRISLARAVYADEDIYFLDDPLSAVDSHVGKHIFENVIGSRGILRKKTRVFVTHSISFLPEVDKIIVLKDGTVSEVGTYKELLEKKGAFSDFLITYLQEGMQFDDLDDLENTLKEEILNSNPEIQRQLSRQKSVISNSSAASFRRRRSSYSSQQSKEEKPIGQKLIEEEKTEIGGVKWEVYKHYLSSIGVKMYLGTIILSIVSQAFMASTNIWLSKWANDPDASPANGTENTHVRNMYLGVYGALGFGQGISYFATICWLLGCLYASKKIHNELLHSITHAPMSFFDTTQLGRILNRFASDISTVDSMLPNWFLNFLIFGISILGTLFVICYSTPAFIAVILPMGLLYYFIQKFYVATSRQLKRLESVSKSPIYSFFGETITGCSSIRAYNAQDRFIRESDKRIDFNQICTYPGLIAGRWLTVRLEMVGSLIIFFSALFAVLGKDTLNPGLVGLSVSYALQITQVLNWLVKMTAEIETSIVSVERIKEYAETPQEASWEISSSSVSSEWPVEGKIQFKDYQVRYREGLDLVLKGINFSVNGGEKVGIVGRTGAGKSSLTLCLFRILEAAGGSILIDGVDIATLGLQLLRSRLTIIPQDPVLFFGTLRLNLDPFGEHSDEQIWRALELAHLKTFVKGLTAGLQSEMSEGGENLSVGQRQLICLARALLRKTKILILDEATAAVDLETDDLIQNTIRSEFKHCTVLTIAHRLNTIIDSDRVLVLDKGMVAEYESPSTLLKNQNSIFYGMAHDAGLV